ncbi:MAG: type III pantothenate kinase [Chloroflexota bacterium]
MLLAVDVGNTNTVAGLFAGGKLVDRWRITTDTSRTADEYAVLLNSLFTLSHQALPDVTDVIIGSVVPVAQETMIRSLQSRLDLHPVVVTPEIDAGLPVHYCPREAVGADRIANAVAAIAEYGAPAVVVDFGTATTFDAVSAEPAYVGGAIAPGLEISQDALFAHAARLTPVPLEAPPEAIGVTTRQSLQAGILYGYAGLVDGLVSRFRLQLGERAAVIATGGLAELVAPLASTVQVQDEDLTLKGLALIHARGHGDQ